MKPLPADRAQTTVERLEADRRRTVVLYGAPFRSQSPCGFPLIHRARPASRDPVTHTNASRAESHGHCKRSVASRSAPVAHRRRSEAAPLERLPLLADPFGRTALAPASFLASPASPWIGSMLTSSESDPVGRSSSVCAADRFWCGGSVRCPPLLVHPAIIRTAVETAIRPIISSIRP